MQGTQHYENNSSLIFKPAAEVTDEKKTWGIQSSPGQESSRTSMQWVYVGKIIAMDKRKNQIVVKDHRHKTKTLYVDSGVMPTLRKGTVIQTMLSPGSSRADKIRVVQ